MLLSWAMESAKCDSTAAYKSPSHASSSPPPTTCNAQRCIGTGSGSGTRSARKDTAALLPVTPGFEGSAWGPRLERQRAVAREHGRIVGNGGRRVAQAQAAQRRAARRRRLHNRLVRPLGLPHQRHWRALGPPASVLCRLARRSCWVLQRAKLLLQAGSKAGRVAAGGFPCRQG